jgi:Txe/YoeB family toxin of Txe-Axe toxin-antitoxin module
MGKEEKARYSLKMTEDEIDALNNMTNENTFEYIDEFETLNLTAETGMSRRAIQQMKNFYDIHRGKNIKSLHKLVEAKTKCYPNNIENNEKMTKVPL